MDQFIQNFTLFLNILSLVHGEIGPLGLVSSWTEYRSYKKNNSFAPKEGKALEWKNKLSMQYASDADWLSYWSIECRWVRTHISIKLPHHTQLNTNI